MIDVLTIGRMKSAHLASLAEDYLGRITRFTPCRHRALRESRHRDESRSGHAILEEEGRRFLEALEKGAFCILLDREGRTMSSEAFSRVLGERAGGPGRQTAFLIGGFLGVSEEVRQRADLVLSLSPLTFPHELALVLLLEQIYRGFTILNRIAYHK